MPTLVTKTCGTGKQLATFSDIRTYVNSVDLLALDQTIELRCSGTIACPNFQTIGPLTSDDTHRVVFLPEAGAGVNDLNRSTFDQGSSGAALSFVRNGETSLASGVDIYDMRWLVTGGTTSGSSATGCTTRNAGSTYDNIIMRNRIYDTSVAEGNLLSAGNQTNKTRFADNLIILTNGLNKTVIFESSTTMIERNTAVALGNAIGDAKFHRGTNNTILRNNVMLGFSYISIIEGTAGVGNFSNRTPTQGKTSGITVLTTANGLVVNDASDFRPKAGGPVVDGADDTANVTQDIIGSNRGGAPDSGAWQLSAFLPLPTGRITNYTSLNGTVTLTGTTTNTPASGVATLTPTSTAYNSAVAKGPVSITLGSGTFTVSFPDTLAGEYLPSVTLTNNGGTQAAVNEAGTVSVVAATGILTSQTLDGQVVSFIGTVSGSPLSGNVQVDVSPSSTNGGTAAGPVDLTITGSNFTGSIPLLPGTYSAPVVRFTNARGTSLPLSGTTPVSIVGIDGNPQAPEDTPAPVDTTAPTMTGAIAVSAQTTSGFTLNWPAATDSVGVAYYEVDNGSGAYVNVGNVLTLVVTGKSSATTYQTRVRALDAAGNASSPLTASATTAAVTPAPDTTPPVFTGTVNVANTTATTATISWSAASDNVAVTGYEYSIDGGTVYVNAGTARTASLAGLNPSTIYSLRVRAYDSAGNRSLAITGSFETESATTPPTGFTPSISRTVRILAGRSVFDAGTFWTVSGNNSPVGSKDPNSTIDIHFDWTSWLEDIGGAELSAVDFILSPELVSVAGVPSETGGTVFVSGGSTGQNMSITCRITTATTPPRIEDRTVVLQIKEQ